MQLLIIVLQSILDTAKLTKFFIFKYNVYHKPVRGILNLSSKQARIKKSLHLVVSTKFSSYNFIQQKPLLITAFKNGKTAGG